MAHRSRLELVFGEIVIAEDIQMRMDSTALYEEQLVTPAEDLGAAGVLVQVGTERKMVGDPSTAEKVMVRMATGAMKERAADSWIQNLVESECRAQALADAVVVVAEVATKR